MEYFNEANNIKSKGSGIIKMDVQLVEQINVRME